MAEKTIYEQALEKLQELKGSILLLAAAEDTEHEVLRKALSGFSRLMADNEALRKALIGVTPSHRKPGTCWCGYGRDIEVGGHERGCLDAHLALKLCRVREVAEPTAKAPGAAPPCVRETRL